VGSADQFALGIVVRGFRVFVEVEAGKTPRPLAKLGILWIGQAEAVEVGVAFALVELVVAALVLLIDWP